ncbi:MAG: YlxR family protein [Desulfobulbaceae bacterium]|nr:YlxR family protein [Desulfobulbaceae bacterium]HIJ77705.1 YlxR family protein [Deltaproteobacteria bacterium]
MSAEKHDDGPVRTCLGCRQRQEKKQLWRFALNANGIVLKDFSGRHGGRHAYCCRSNSCLKKFFDNKKGLSRTFRLQVLGFDEGLNDLFGSD